MFSLLFLVRFASSMFPDLGSTPGWFLSSAISMTSVGMQPGGLRKRCHWFDEPVESVDADGANSSSPNNFSISSPRRNFGRHIWKEEKSWSSVQTLKDKDCHSANCAEYSHATPPATYSRHMQVCLPPGCIPTDVILQVPQNDTQSTPQWGKG